jgi:hypothetical protein
MLRPLQQPGKLRQSLQDGRSPGRDLNPGPPEYEGVLTTRPRCSKEGGENYTSRIFVENHVTHTKIW